MALGTLIVIGGWVQHDEARLRPFEPVGTPVVLEVGGGCVCW